MSANQAQTELGQRRPRLKAAIAVFRDEVAG
jgi:hypothetical protein